MKTAHEQQSCIFCEKSKQQTEQENFILARFSYTFVILNTFPYNNGHMMVVPYRHVPSLSQLDDNELLELMKVTQLAEKVLNESFAPQGFNIGLNLGRCAGAGIEDHIHIHIVPRWNGDTNFMPIISETKVLPELLNQTYQKLQPLFARLK